MGERFIQGPPGFDDFEPGDYVAHITAGDGVVETITDTVNVRYMRRVGKSEYLLGKYDRHWFTANPHFLFHRGVKRTEAAR